jgi:hypothetical protein
MREEILAAETGRVAGVLHSMRSRDKNPVELLLTP